MRFSFQLKQRAPEVTSIRRRRVANFRLVSQSVKAEYHKMITDREFTHFWTNAQRSLRSYAFYLCRDPLLIDDLVQQTALQAWGGRHGLRPDSNVRAWLFAILRNCHFSQRRRRKYEVEDPDGTLVENFAVHPTYYAERDLADVSVAFQELPENQRQALTHTALRGLSYAETARLCACKEGTIKSRVARARQRLLELVDPAAPRSQVRAAY
jgi:RNA polymerase sigma-70 factor, ECF subfamily